MNTEIKDPQQYNFIRATIKIANPNWTVEQIEAATKIRIQEIENPHDDGCEMCSG